jgi:hypothetical protein
MAEEASVSGLPPMSVDGTSLSHGGKKGKTEFDVCCSNGAMK